MREIKFRFKLELIVEQWGTYKKGDTDFFCISLINGKSGLISYPINTKNWKIISCDEFTGLKDKNGKDIYENDLVRFYFDEKPKKIVFDKIGYEGQWNGMTGFGFKEEGMSFIELNYHDDYSLCEVIGNIHENSSLLT